jgi:hypothetical protein
MEIQLIEGLKISEKTLMPFYKKLGKRNVQFMVFRTKHKTKTFFCAFCGGSFETDGLYLTETGQAAFEALANLQLGNNTFCLREIKGGPKNVVANKITDTFDKMGNFSSIAFVGDFADELDDPISQIVTYGKIINKKDIKRRSGMSLKLRFEVMKRDLYRCQLCGKSAKDDVCLEIDHIIPKARGGDDSLDNLRTLCYDCNRGKGDRLE